MTFAPLPKLRAPPLPAVTSAFLPKFLSPPLPSVTPTFPGFFGFTFPSSNFFFLNFSASSPTSRAVRPARIERSINVFSFLLNSLNSFADFSPPISFIVFSVLSRILYPQSIKLTSPDNNPLPAPPTISSKKLVTGKIDLPNCISFGSNSNNFGSAIFKNVKNRNLLIDSKKLPPTGIDGKEIAPILSFFFSNFASFSDLLPDSFSFLVFT